MASTGNLVDNNIISLYIKCLSVKKIVLKLKLSLNKQSIDLKNLQAANWDEMRVEQKLHLVWFGGLSTIVGYLMPNPLYTYI